ncbi:MAG: hypothetical protein LBQ66_07585 [Planctomycetaceae bacterium]|nr:hypothetical protein [Planctomycetaceae bacterium]
MEGTPRQVGERLPTRLGVQFKLVRFYYAQRRAGHPRYTTHLLTHVFLRIRNRRKIRNRLNFGFIYFSRASDGIVHNRRCSEAQPPDRDSLQQSSRAATALSNACVTRASCLCVSASKMLALLVKSLLIETNEI